MNPAVMARASLAASWRPLLLAVAVAGAVLLLTRLLLGLLIQYPAPDGDSVLFASVAHYHCGTGRFETPIFPLDPAGGIRYVWHGIGHPALLSWLSPTCDVAGLYLAQTLILLAAGALAWLTVAPRRGQLLAVLFALVVMTLLAKQGFRPETSATVLALLAEWMRARQRSTAWALAVGLQAWVQPTTFILYLAWVLASADAAELRRLLRQAPVWLPSSLLLQAGLWLLYPFPLHDLLQGLSQQGQSFAQRSDGSFFLYLIRSDFFPLFGLLFAAAFAQVAAWRPRVVLLLPLLWFYGWRVPPTYYNLVPVFAWLLLALLLREEAGTAGTSDTDRRPVATVLAGALLATGGLSQSALRDVNSWLQYGTTQTVARAQWQSLRSQGLVACAVPAHFTLMLPADAFERSHTPRLLACGLAPEWQRRDLVSSVAMKNRPDAGACTQWPQRHGLPGVDKVFRSDSGYGFHVCPARTEGAAR